MKFNIEFYKEEQDKLSEEEKRIVDIISQDKNYSEVIEKEPTVNNYIHLSSVKENLLNWYEFKENSSLLEIGSGFGELSSLFVEKLSDVVLIEASLTKAKILEKKFEQNENVEIIVGDYKEISLEKKFDYIVITDYLENNDFCETLEKAKMSLKENGTIFVAIDNKYGIKNWKGNDDYKNLLNKDVTFTKKHIENSLSKLGFRNYKFYYIFPEYKAPNLIYTDSHKLSDEDLSRNFELNEAYEYTNFKENEILENLLKDEKDLINFFVNSFLIEISDLELNDIKYITFTNYRKPDKQIQTIITDNKVIKKPVTKEAEIHIKEMIENSKFFPKDGCVLLDKKKDDITVESDFIIGKRLDEMIDSSDNVIEEFNSYKELLFNSNLKIAYEEIDRDKLIEPLKEIDNEVLKELTFTEYGFVDMIPKNCFVIGGMKFFFDQEWMLKFIPLEFILYRAINNTGIKSSIRKQLFDKYELTKNGELFDKIEDYFMNSIINKKLLTHILIRSAVSKNERISSLIETINLKDSSIINLENQNRILESQNNSFENETNTLKETVNNLENIVKIKDTELMSIINSKSWKITKPFRWISTKIKRLISKLKKGENN